MTSTMDGRLEDDQPKSTNKRDFTKYDSMTQQWFLDANSFQGFGIDPEIPAESDGQGRENLDPGIQSWSE